MPTRESAVRWVRQPASAAVAGIIFAVILGAVIVLLRSSLPEDAVDLGQWTQDPGRRDAVTRALSLIPFAGIALLWFIAVLRTLVGSDEDRFIGTVFLGSGLLFIALLFAAASVLRAVLALQDAGIAVGLETRAFGWTLASALLGSFGTRMAAVFVATVATAGRRSGAVPTWLGVIGYLVAVLLLLTPPLPTAVQFLFPGWVFVLSVWVLFGRRTSTQRTST